MATEEDVFWEVLHFDHVVGLQISSYNCRGLPKTRDNLLLRPDIHDLLDTSDIVCLQETWYSK